ncbi:MAG: 5-(carboxyamino)imidazole ribonucleotide synthase [Cellvibrionales bacterium]|nr:5-(carboxyamino)imidazole ribonucleotide synthase [Cellvibrionales bacterium]
MRIAIVGCGQLSRMLALAGIPMGIKFSFIAEGDEDSRCVEQLGSVVRWQPGANNNNNNVGDLYAALGKPLLLTVEKEQVDTDILYALQEYCTVHPNPAAFAACQHRYREKQLLEKLSIPCVDYCYGLPADAQAAGLDLPLVVKSCRHGYDGKNQWVLKTARDLADFLGQAREERYIVERQVAFEREISQVSVRSIKGEICHYPLTENWHERGMLVRSLAPAPGVSASLRRCAQDYVCRIMEALDYVGVLAMECFVVGDELLVNELAPRVHNSGHWTQSGGLCSQFENHLRALFGMPLGSARMPGAVGMFNLIGIERPPLDCAPADGALHWYDKTVRRGRKLGHINFCGATVEAVGEEIRDLVAAYTLRPVR